VGGAHLAETLVKSVPATATGLVLRSGSCSVGVGVRVCGTVGVVRLVAVFGASCWVLREQALVGLFLGAWSCRRDCPRVGVCRCGWVGWSLFENCTVDASIFGDMHLWVCVVF
jgi:hypothetical protein